MKKASIKNLPQPFIIKNSYYYKLYQQIDDYIWGVLWLPFYHLILQNGNN